jgi:NADPH:quinone reductase-like Zn-dependent oxidoreductase
VVGAAHKVDAARSLGAGAVIDKSAEPLWSAAERHAPEGYHAIFDANGPATLRESYAHLAPTGRLVVYGFHSMLPRRGGRPGWLRLLYHYLRTPRFNPFRMTEENRSVMAFNLSYLFENSELLTEAMTRLLGWCAEGRIRPPPIQPFPLERVADAHRALESATTVGKLVLLP